VDGQSADWDESDDLEVETTTSPELDKEWQEYYDAVTTPPPVYIRILTYGFGWSLTLILAVTIMAQWALWFILTSQFFNGWGGIAGGLIAAVQIWLMFGTAEKKSACRL
jgi:hypothetical protein